MKKKFYLFLLVVLCCIFTFPTVVKADEYNYQYVDYHFTMQDEAGENIEGLHFKLYDESKLFQFESKYNEEDNYYYFDVYTDDKDISASIPQGIKEFSGAYDSIPNSCDTFASNFDNIVGNYPSFSVGTKHCYYNSSFDYYGSSTYSVNRIIPLVLEEESRNIKKIVFGYIHYNIDFGNRYYKFILVNSESYKNKCEIEEQFSQSWYGDSYSYYWNDIRCRFFYNIGWEYKRDLSLSVLAYSDLSFFNEELNNPDYQRIDGSLSFMRNAMYDYSDELWEELNSGPIASSEIQYDNSDNDLSSPKTIIFNTNNNKTIYSKYKSNVNYRFKVKNGNGMNFKLHDISNTFNFSSLYDKDSDTYSIVDNSSDSDYQDGIKEFSKIIIDEVKNGNFSGLADKYKSITSDNCSSDGCDIYTYIPMILEGENKDNYAKQIVLGLLNVQYRQESGNDYYDIGLSIYNNTCDLLNSNIDANQSELINLSRAIEKDYSSNLMNQYSDGSISMDEIYKDVDVNNVKDEYCNKLPVISLRQNPKTLNNGILVLIISMIIVIGSSFALIRKKHNN